MKHLRLTCFVLAFFAATAIAQDISCTNSIYPLPQREYPGYSTSPNSVCLGVLSRNAESIVTGSWLTGARYMDCLNACNADSTCKGFAVRPCDGVCFAVTNDCEMHRNDREWTFYNKNGPTQRVVVVHQPTVIVRHEPVPVSFMARYPEFNYVASHCQGTPMGGKIFYSIEECRNYCLAQPGCFGISVRVDRYARDHLRQALGQCTAKTASCRWIRDEQFAFYQRAYNVAYVPAPRTVTTLTHPERYAFIRYSPVNWAGQAVWAQRWPLFNDFSLLNGHCQGGALRPVEQLQNRQPDCLNGERCKSQAEQCRDECLRDQDCYGFSLRSDGLCIPKSHNCQWTPVVVNEWKFYKLLPSSVARNQPFVKIIDVNQLGNYIHCSGTNCPTYVSCSGPGC